MAMVVQHNITAMNSNRQLGVTTSAQAKSSEKLSSGFKINRAADDAAGLTISEKMRKQMRGLDRAATNAQDGVSAVQTAEGALTEVHSMLQRMNELAVQSANGTNSKTDRDAIQAEIKQLETEIDRVSETTKFNETYLLKGSNVANNNSASVKNTNDVGKYRGISVAAGEAKTIKSGDTLTLGTVMLQSSDTNIAVAKDAKAGAEKLASATMDGSDTVTYTLKDGTSGSMTKDEFNTEYGVSFTSAGSVTFNLAVGDGSTEVASNATAYNNTTSKYNSDFSNANLNGYKIGDNVEAKATVAADGSITLSDTEIANPLEFNLHVGADSTANNKISVTIESMSSEAIGVKGLDVSSEAAATTAIDTISAAIQKVSEQRSALGAVQNRLEHTIANLDNVVENTTAAESRIRDTDMAKEMVNYSKNNILAQAGQSMLAQANQSNQGVLSLLQ